MNENKAWMLDTAPGIVVDKTFPVCVFDPPTLDTVAGPSKDVNTFAPL